MVDTSVVLTRDSVESWSVRNMWIRDQAKEILNGVTCKKTISGTSEDTRTIVN